MSETNSTQIHAAGEATGFIPAPPSERGKFPARQPAAYFGAARDLGLEA